MAHGCDGGCIGVGNALLDEAAAIFGVVRNVSIAVFGCVESGRQREDATTEARVSSEATFLSLATFTGLAWGMYLWTCAKVRHCAIVRHTI